MCINKALSIHTPMNGNRIFMLLKKTISPSHSLETGTSLILSFCRYSQAPVYLLFLNSANKVRVFLTLR